MNKIQELMDSAYDKWDVWRKEERIGYSSFVHKLDQYERFAVLAGNLNYQVGNGGFIQWYWNEYSKEGQSLLSYLAEYKDTKPAFDKVYQIVYDVLGLIEDTERIENNGYIDDGEEIDAKLLRNELNNDLSYYTKEYFKINKAFLNELEEHLLKVAA